MNDSALCRVDDRPLGKDNPVTSAKKETPVVGSINHVETTLGVMRNSFLGSENDCISDELIRKFEDHDDSHEDNLSCERESLLKDKDIDGDENSLNTKDSEQESLNNKTATDCHEGENMLKEKEPVCPPLKENETSLPNPIGDNEESVSQNSDESRNSSSSCGNADIEGKVKTKAKISRVAISRNNVFGKGCVGDVFKDKDSPSSRVEKGDDALKESDEMVLPKDGSEERRLDINGSVLKKNQDETKVNQCLDDSNGSGKICNVGKKLGSNISDNDVETSPVVNNESNSEPTPKVSELDKLVADKTKKDQSFDAGNKNKLKKKDLADAGNSKGKEFSDKLGENEHLNVGNDLEKAQVPNIELENIGVASKANDVSLEDKRDKRGSSRPDSGEPLKGRDELTHSDTCVEDEFHEDQLNDLEQSSKGSKCSNENGAANESETSKLKTNQSELEDYHSGESIGVKELGKKDFDDQLRDSDQLEERLEKTLQGNNELTKVKDCVSGESDHHVFGKDRQDEGEKGQLLDKVEESREKGQLHEKNTQSDSKNSQILPEADDLDEKDELSRKDTQLQEVEDQISEKDNQSGEGDSLCGKDSQISGKKNQMTVESSLSRVVGEESHKSDKNDTILSDFDSNQFVKDISQEDADQVVEKDHQLTESNSDLDGEDPVEKETDEIPKEDDELDIGDQLSTISDMSVEEEESSLGSDQVQTTIGAASDDSEGIGLSSDNDAGEDELGSTESDTGSHVEQEPEQTQVQRCQDRDKQVAGNSQPNEQLIDDQVNNQNTDSVQVHLPVNTSENETVVTTDSGGQVQTTKSGQGASLTCELIENQSPIIVHSTRKSLTSEETQFVKIGQIQACSVEIERMTPELIKAYTLGRIKIRGSQGKTPKRYLCIPYSLRLKIARDLSSGMSRIEVANRYGVSKTTVGRIKLKMKVKEKKSLKLARNIGSVFPIDSKRALTFSTRVKIMGKLERGFSIEALSHEYGINKSTLKTLRRLKNEKLRERQNSSESSGSQETPDRPVKEMNKIPTNLELVNKKTSKIFNRPKCFLSVLLILILQNTETKTLTYAQIKRLLCYLFPFYSKEWKDRSQWRKNLGNAMQRKAKNFFLKTRVNVKGDKWLFTLNPQEEENWKNYLRSGTQSLRNEAESVMRRPELLESLLLGIMRLDTWNVIDEDLKNDLGEDEEGKSHLASDFLDTSKSSTSSDPSPKKNQGNVYGPSPSGSSVNTFQKDSLEQKNVLKRKCDSPSEQSRKFPKTVKPQCSTENHGATSLRPGAGLGICDTNVNNRLVNLLMGKEKPQSEKSKSAIEVKKSSPAHESPNKPTDSSNKDSVKNSESSSKTGARPSSSVMVDSAAIAGSALKKVDAKKKEAKSPSPAGLSSVLSEPWQEKAPCTPATGDMAEVKMEVSPTENRQISLQNEDENLPKIVSVEDRAYHMWLPTEQDSPEAVEDELASDKKNKKQKTKIFGKSLLSLVKKGGSKTSRKEHAPPKSSFDGVDERVPEHFNTNETHFSRSHAVTGISHSQPHQSIAGVSHSQPTQSGMSHSWPSLTMSGISHPHPIQSVAGISHSQPSQSGVGYPQPSQSMSRMVCFPPPLIPAGMPHFSQMPGHPSFVPPSPNVLTAMGPPPSRLGTNGRPLQHRNPVETPSQSVVVPQEYSGRPIVNLNVSRPLSSWTPTLSQLPQRSKLSKEGEEKSSVPNVTMCVETWQKVFPWMYYQESERAFICNICEWASTEQHEVEVFRLQTPKDVYLVAGQLRYHKETKNHRIVALKKEKISELIDYVYPILKGHLQEISGVEDIIKTVSDLAGGTFPGPLESPQKEYFMTYMIRHIAECVEDKLFESLAQSPFFSVITVKDKDYAIIRWLNNIGESEEHFFCTQIGFPGEAMSCLNYLKRKNVNMNKLISYSILSNLIGTNLENAVMLQVPVRYPPLSVCLEWLDKASFLKNLFQQLTVLTRLCKSSYHKFAAFPEAAEFTNMTEPYSHKCIVNEKIINFFFGNIKVLRKIALDIYKTTGNMEAFGFSALELQDYDSLMRCSALFPKLHSIMSSKHSDSQSLCTLLKDFRSKICQRLGKIKHKNSNEYIVMSLVDIFLSHVMLTLLSPGKEITDIFSKKLRHLSAEDLEKILPNLMSEYQLSSAHCLANLHALRVQLEKSRDSSLLQLLAILVSKSELGQQYPELYRLYQKITVLPFLHAHVEQCMFNVAAAEVFLTSKVEKRLMLPVTLILLEGPTVDQFDKDHIMSVWSRKWKISNLHKHLKNSSKVVVNIMNE